MLFNTIFQFVLKKIYATWKDLKVRALTSVGCERSLGHLEYALLVIR